jgi:hypothetical protein
VPVDFDRVVTLDFETFFDREYSLKNKAYNTSSYVRSPQFVAHCVSVKIGAGPTKVYWYEDIGPALHAIDWTQYGVLCHHTNFDGLILSHHYGVIPCFYYDTLSMAKGLHSNQIGMSLGIVAKIYGIGNKLESVLDRMKGHRCIPMEMREAASAYCAKDTDLCYALFRTMVRVYPETELRLIDLTCRLFCDPVIQIDEPRVEKELAREIAAKEEQVARCGYTEDDLQSAPRLANILLSLGVDPPRKISPRTHQETWAFSLQDEDFVGLGAHPDERVRDVIAARFAVKSTMGETRAARLLTAGRHGAFVPIYLNYYGAHTGRWSGGDKLNFQNLPRAEYDANNQYVYPSAELRRSLTAPAGSVIVVCDSAQIEARTLAWLAGEDAVVTAFRNKEDLYSSFASGIYGFPVNKREHPTQRFVGKVSILGLGYGMGALKFQGTLALGLMGPKVELGIGECAKIVNFYRNTNRQIKKLWDRLEGVLQKMCVKSSNGVDTASVFKEGVLEYDDGSLWLPNGMPLHYPDLKGDYDQETDSIRNFTYRAGRQYKYIYGGKMAENVTQALARIIVAEQMLTIAERWRVVSMSHDEVIALAPVAQAEECLNDMMTAMRRPPAWCADLPLDAEGGFAVNYSK